MVPRIIVCWAASESAKLWGTTRASPRAGMFRPLRGKTPTAQLQNGGHRSLFRPRLDGICAYLRVNSRFLSKWLPATRV